MSSRPPKRPNDGRQSRTAVRPPSSPSRWSDQRDQANGSAKRAVLDASEARGPQRPMLMLAPPSSSRPDLVPPPPQPKPKSRVALARIQLMRGVLGLGIFALASLIVVLMVRGGTQTGQGTNVPAQPQPLPQITLVATAVAQIPAVAPTAVPMVELKPFVMPESKPQAPAPTATIRPSELPVSAARRPVGALAERYPGVFFSGRFDPDDGRPVYVCGVTSFSTYLTALHMQSIGADVAHGFHLGIFPHAINDDENSIPRSQVAKNLTAGTWDCDLGTADNVAQVGHGAITAIIDESLGGDGIFARDVASIYDLRGKRIGFEQDSSSEYFVRHTMLIANLTEADVTLVPFEVMEQGVEAFNKGDIDALSAYDPNFETLPASGGKPLLMSDELRVIVDVIVTSRKSIMERRAVVQAFHEAWFDTLKRQVEDYDAGARAIADWGYNDWSAVSASDASKDYRGMLKTAAQADANANAQLLNNPQPLLTLMSVANELYAERSKVTSGTLSSLIDPSFVNEIAASGKYSLKARPVNDNFLLGQPVKQTGSETIKLPCTRFNFVPNSAQLDYASKRILDACVLPLLRQYENARLQMTGSAAWPGPAGTYTETQIKTFGLDRAQAVANYLIANGIKADRLTLESVLPPPERRELVNDTRSNQDRTVTMLLNY